MAVKLERWWVLNECCCRQAAEVRHLEGKLGRREARAQSTLGILDREAAEECRDHVRIARSTLALLRWELRREIRKGQQP